MFLSDGDNIGTDINSLSGGEKSYAQMCLIASLWENMSPPFRLAAPGVLDAWTTIHCRALDEWDVFLDNINRKQISRTLLGFGLQKPDYQFIYIR
jgi:chromosome segregation ATPase